MRDSLSVFGFLSLGFSHIFSASLQRELFACEGRDGLCAAFPPDGQLAFLAFHTELVEQLFSGEISCAPVPVPGAVSMATAVLQSSARLCRGELFWHLEPAVISSGRARFAAALADGIMTMLGVDGNALCALRDSFPIYPAAPSRSLVIGGRIQDGTYVVNITGPDDRAEFVFDLLLPLTG